MTKIRITATDFILPKGTVLEVGDVELRIWSGKYEVVPVKAEAKAEDDKRK